MSISVGLNLDEATWPALMVNTSGAVQNANPAARNFFGERLERCEFAHLGEGETASTGFLSLCDRLAGQLVPLKFRAKQGNANTFLTFITAWTVEGQKTYLFQLFPSGSSPSAQAQEGRGPVEMNVAQKQKLDCALQLTRTVALDFKNALTTIMGHNSYVLAQIQAEHPYRFSLGEVQKAAEKAADIAHDLALFTLEDKFKTGGEAGNLNRVLRAAVHAVEAKAGKNLVWTQHYENRLYAVVFDEAKLQQAFVKILENAVEAMSSAAALQGQITIQTANLELKERFQDGKTTLAPGTYVAVEVIDDGCGIDQTALPRIFEPFFTTKQGHRGLGLAWVYGIVTNHGGGLSVRSTGGRGTTVKVYLPATRHVVEETNDQEAFQPGKGTILFVDDEEMVVCLAAMLLSSVGYDVLTAKSAEEAIEILTRTSHPIDLLITDMVMPSMDGKELIEHFRALSPTTRVICSTACVRTANTFDIVNILSKPYTSQELLLRVKQVLAQ